ncbi:MAG: PilW family protein, partial [Thiothrix sp.]
MRYRQTQRGLSLIELMIAMVVSLVLIAGVGTVYISSKRNYQARDQLSLMDESARIALTALSKHLEHAGYATPTKLPIGAYL